MPRPRRDGTPAAPPNRRLLTDSFVRAIAPAAKVFMVWDTKVPGLGLAVHPTRRTWKLVYRRDAHPRWLHIGDLRSIPLRDARRLAARASLEIAAGGDPAADRRRARTADTFTELHADYVKLHARRHNRSWRQADTLIRAHVLSRIGRSKAGDVSRGDVKAILARLSDRPATANQTLAAVSAVFSWALQEEVGGVTSNPCARISRHPARSRERVLADGELRTLWPDLDSTLRLILLTGARPGEAASMRAEDVAGRVWNLPGEPAQDWPGTKNNRSHRIPLSDLATGIVDAHLARRPKRRTSEELLKRLWARHGFPKITPHDLRRSFGTLVARFGFGRQAMDRLLNHADRSVGSIYDRHGYETEDRRIVDAISRHVQLEPDVPD
jgi:integrase